MNTKETPFRLTAVDVSNAAAELRNRYQHECGAAGRDPWIDVDDVITLLGKRLVAEDWAGAQRAIRQLHNELAAQCGTPKHATRTFQLTQHALKQLRVLLGQRMGVYDER